VRLGLWVVLWSSGWSWAATVDQTDIRGSGPHDWEPSGAASSKVAGHPLRVPHRAFEGSPCGWADNTMIVRPDPTDHTLDALPVAPGTFRLPSSGMSRPSTDPDPSSCAAPARADIGQGHHDQTDHEPERAPRPPPAPAVTQTPVGFANSYVALVKDASATSTASSNQHQSLHDGSCCRRLAAAPSTERD
jgi:hypothetical protein